MAANYIIKKIYVCSPFAGATKEETECNITFAREACKFVVNYNPGQPYMPIAPHLLFPQFLNDNSELERGIGKNFGLNLISSLCDEVWVFGDKLSTGMAEELAFARYIPFKKIRYFKDDGSDDYKPHFVEIQP